MRFLTSPTAHLTNNPCLLHASDPRPYLGPDERDMYVTIVGLNDLTGAGFSNRQAAAFGKSLVQNLSQDEGMYLLLLAVLLY